MAEREKQTKAEFSVEASLVKLEKYVSYLEGNETNLDDAFKAFEKAVKLSGKLKKKLEDYERKIEVITGTNESGEALTQNLDDIN